MHWLQSRTLFPGTLHMGSLDLIPYTSLTCVAMSPFSSTIDGGRSASADRCAVSASASAAAVEDARIHRLGCRLPLLQLPSKLLEAAERPGHAAARELE